MEKQVHPTFAGSLLTHLAPLAAILAVLALARVHSYLTFHFLVEIFSAVIGAMTFVVVWNHRSGIRDQGLLMIGIASLFVAAIDLFHALAYAGSGMFAEYAPDLPTQLWLIARYIEACSYVVGLLLLGRRARPGATLAGYTLVVVALVAAAYPLRVFPTAYLAGVGLTPFKIASEYVIAAAVTAAGVIVIRRRRRFLPDSWSWFACAMFTTAVSELLFTGYLGVYDTLNMLGHYLKAVSFYFIYRGFVVVGIQSPHRLLMTRLERQERTIAEHELLLREVHHRVKNNLALVTNIIEMTIRAGGPFTHETLVDLSARIAAIREIHDTLHQSSNLTSQVRLDRYLSGITDSIVSNLATARIERHIDVDPVAVATRDAVSLGIISAEIITNAIKYGLGDGGTLSVSARADGERLRLTYENDGHPYREGSPGLGTMLINELVRQFKGVLSLETEGRTRYSIELTIPGLLGSSPACRAHD